MDKKGIGGFMEAMLAMMAVTVTITAFIGVLAYAHAEPQERDIDTSFLSGLRIEDGRICNLDEDAITSYVLRIDASGITVKVEIVGDALSDSLRFTYGKETGHTSFKEGTLTLDSDDGRRLLAHYEVVVWG